MPPADAESKVATLASAAYGRLRREIIAVEIPPGSRLHTRQLCARYDMGLSPIREALSRLSSEGLVRQSDQRGFVVTQLTGADLDALTRTRCWLNEIGLRESIAHGDDAWEKSVIVSFHRLSRCLVSSSMRATRSGTRPTRHSMPPSSRPAGHPG